MKAMDAEGAAIGSRSSSLDMSKQGWQRSGGFIFELPPGTDSYTVEILANGFVGTCHLDAFLSEPKPFSRHISMVTATTACGSMPPHPKMSTLGGIS